MASPDVAAYVDLTVYDLDPQAVVDKALADATAKMADWQPREGNTEVVLVEALGLEVAELAYAVNRVPGAVLEVLLRLFGLTRDPGRAPSVDVAITVADSLGHTIPAGTRLILDLGVGLEPIELDTTEDAIIAPGSTSATVTALAAGPTAAANGTPTATALQLVDPVPYVTAAATSGVITDGLEPEDGQAFLERGVVRLSRLVTTLVRADQFTAAALEEVYVARATTVDLWTPNTIPTPAAPTATGFITGGTLAAGTYTYRISAVNAAGETLASTSANGVVASGTTGRVDLSWTAPSVPAGVGPITGYRVYGRTGTLVRRGTTAAGVLTFSDTGGAGTGEALPTANTTGPAVGTAAGFVTVFAAGPAGAPLSAPDKATLLAKLQSQALASLTITVADPTLNTVAVDVTVTVLPGYTAATVIAAVKAAVRDYLSPATWPWAATVYRNELIALVDRVAGVDRVAALTAPAADVVLTGVGPLVQAGTVTVNGDSS